MAVLATPNTSSYIIKKESASKIAQSKCTPASEAKIKDRALLFEANNLRKKLSKG